MSASYDAPPAFSATVHEPGEVPAKFWRLIELQYPNGRSLCLVYTAEPTDSSELPRLMWQLQCSAAVYRFTIIVIDADGTTEAPPVPLRSRRAGS
jgi:hypothetical protein